MPLPRIPNPAAPVVIPAVAQQSFPDLFIVSFTANVNPTNATTDQFFSMRTWPFNYDLNAFHPDADEIESVFRFADPFGLAAEYPVVAQAIGAVALAGTLMIALKAAREVLASLQAALDAATANLTNAQSALNALPPDDPGIAAATQAVADATTAQTAAQSPVTAQLAVIAGIETQLGKV